MNTKYKEYLKSKAIKKLKNSLYVSVSKMKNKKLLKIKCINPSSNGNIKVGDIITISGIYKKKKKQS